jgi:hypothetical protein
MCNLRIVRFVLLVLCCAGALTARAASVVTTLPVETNAWDLAHLFIIDKDTNSVFVNANDNYLQSLQKDFPQIHSLADFQGKTDFDFYPADLANRYRADDARVIAGGVPWETIEPYQPSGGATGYVYTSKTPLRDTNGVIYALRAQFYTVPDPGQTTLPVFDTAWLQANAIVIDKDTNSVFINANENFLASLRPTFPEIKTVTNLIGRDDFYFYPTNDALKYRAFRSARLRATNRSVACGLTRR